MAHSAYGVCYYKLPVRQQAALVRAASAVTPWPNAPTGPVASTMAYGAQQMATAMATWLYYAGTATTQPLPVASAAAVTTNMRKVR